MVAPTKSSSWHALPALDAVSQLKSNAEKGLSQSEVASRRERYGRNTFSTVKRKSVLSRVVAQFKSPLIFILLFAGLATVFLGDYVDAVVIGIALVISVVVGIVQEGRASRAFETLATSQEHHATVLREGTLRVILREELVPGDIVSLESGTAIPADLRLIEADTLEVNESALTGEWMGVSKDTQLIGQGESLSHRSNMAWMGTLVVGGTGRGVVVDIGNQTQIGSIAAELTEERKEKTPIQKNTEQLAVFLSWFILGIVLVLFVLGILRGETLTDMLLLAIAVAVSVIPEGLPAAVTIVLAVGMERILKKGGLVRNLLAAETLGGTTVILTDKTGTLTQARMDLARIVTLSSGVTGTVVPSVAESPDAEHILKGAVLSSDGFIEEETGEVKGRPIEKAIVEAGKSVGITKDSLSGVYTQTDFLAFDTENRFAGAVVDRSRAKKYRLYASGAPETLLRYAQSVLVEGRELVLSKERKKELQNLLDAYTEKGMRLLAVLYADGVPEVLDEDARRNGKELLKGGVMMGFLAFADPVRTDVPRAIREAQQSGARIIMLTGDNPQTGQFVADAVGIAQKGETPLTGTDIEHMSDEELLQALEKTHVFARVLPKQKMRIAELLQGQGEVVAMTGDGINDAPALRRANIGIAVGSGTEVAKEASDLILLKDSFSIIVSAIKEGRRIIDNLKKIVSHLLATSFGEVFVIGGAIIAGLPLPILPAQILWLNIIEEGLLSFAFAFEPPERDVMKRNPRSEQVKSILTPDVRFIILASGIVTGIVLLTLFFILEGLGTPIEEVRTVMFVGLSLDAIIFSLSLKHLRRPVWQTNMFSNPFLLVAFAVSVGLLFITLAFEPLRTLLSLTPLTPLEFLFLAGIGIIDVITIEVVKKISTRYLEKKLAAA